MYKMCSISFNNNILNNNINTPKDEVTAPGDLTKSSSILRSSEKKTLWVGDLDRAEKTVDEEYIRINMFYEFSKYIVSIKICRDKNTRKPAYGFVEFSTHKHAKYVYEYMNGKYVPGKYHKYKLNWANFNLINKPENKVFFSKPATYNNNNNGINNNKNNINSNSYSKFSDYDKKFPNDGNQKRLLISKYTTCPADSYSVWIGGLDPNTCREEVEELFSKFYSSVCFVKLIFDNNTGSCKGFGFVHFLDSNEAERSIEEMNGALCHKRCIRVNRSNTSRVSGSGNGGGSNIIQNAFNKIYNETAEYAKRIANEYCQNSITYNEENRNSLYNNSGFRINIRGIEKDCPEDEIYRHFSYFGEITFTKNSGGSKGFVIFAEKTSATNAYKYMDGAFIGPYKICLENANFEIKSDNAYENNTVNNWGEISYTTYIEKNEKLNENKLFGGLGHNVSDYKYIADPNYYYYNYYKNLKDISFDTYADIYNKNILLNTNKTQEQEVIYSKNFTFGNKKKKRNIYGEIFYNFDHSLTPPELLSSTRHKRYFEIKNNYSQSFYRHSFDLGFILSYENNSNCSFEYIDDEFVFSKYAVNGACKKKFKSDCEMNNYCNSIMSEYIYSTPIDVVFQCL